MNAPRPVSTVAPFSPLRSLEAVAPVLARHASRSPETAPFVLIGVVRTPESWVGGLLAFADTDFAAHLLRRELARYAEPRFGGVGIKRTAAHPRGPTFDVEAWRRRVEQLPEAARDGRDLAGLAAL